MLGCIIITKEYIKISVFDNSKTICIHLKLFESGFEKYYCEQEIPIGLNMIHLQKRIKNIDNNGSVLSLYIEKNTPDKFCIQVDDSFNSTRIIYRLNTLAINVEHVEIPSIIEPLTLELSSKDFSKYIHILHGVEDVNDLDMKIINNEFKLSCGTHEDHFQNDIIISYNKDDEKCEPITEEIIQGIFPLSSLNKFMKFSDLSKRVNICLINDQPLILKYNIDAMGNDSELKLILAPRSHDED